MRILRTVIFLAVATFVGFTRCLVGCDDCLELTAKNVIYHDPEGYNLLFGDSAIFNPDSVYIQSGNNQPDLAWQNSEIGSIQFFLMENINQYKIFLSDSIVDTLEFTLTQQKSTECCGNRTISTKTLLNSSEVENSDFITIVK